ncbi:type I-G CRISPR-associated protein Csb2 [Spongiactinospora gelatinilytica]|nr:type I-U CRISPR-associated protein Csb2 [Spongiactinospora gelatinilytica]
MPFALHVRLRHGRYDAGGMQPGSLEWPPHPARVFCALVASAQCQEDWDALGWLERSGSPQVWADASVSATRIDSYVVTNQVEARGGSQTWPGRTNGARSRASVTPEGEDFAVIWPEAVVPAEVLARLQRMAFGVPYVGRSTSQSEVTAATVLPGERQGWTRWAPSHVRAAQVCDLRVPYPGYVEALREVYDLGGRAWEVARAVPYAPLVDEQPVAEPVRLPWDDLMIWGFERPRARIGGDQVLRFTTVLRKAVLDHVGTDVPPQVSGHGADDRAHVAFLALPDVGHGHADGHLLGVALALPRDMPAEEWKRLVRAVAGEDRLAWLAPWSKRKSIELRYGADPRRRTLAVQTWRGSTGGSRSWVTATPMVTDGMIRARRNVEDLVAKSLLRVGCPEPVELEVSPAPLIEGAIWRPRCENVPRNRLANRPMVHVRVRFDRPVVGPLLAGSLRYLGLGLFVPVGDEA